MSKVWVKTVIKTHIRWGEAEGNKPLELDADGGILCKRNSEEMRQAVLSGLI